MPTGQLRACRQVCLHGHPLPEALNLFTCTHLHILTAGRPSLLACSCCVSWTCVRAAALATWTCKSSSTQPPHFHSPLASLRPWAAAASCHGLVRGWRRVWPHGHPLPAAPSPPHFCSLLLALVSALQLLRVMDLYAGGGGFGYMDTRSQLGSVRDRVEVRTDWAMDYETDMAATFKANFQHTHVSKGGFMG